MKAKLKFADAESIALVKEYEHLVAVLDTYDSLILRKRRANYRKQPVRSIKCSLCYKEISSGSLYYSASKRSAHDGCVDKAHDRKRELGPDMGEIPKRMSLVKT